MYYYKAYNLIIDSSIKLPELMPAVTHQSADLTIREGDTPEYLETVDGSGVVYQANQSQFLLKLDNVGRYLVQNGNEIVVSPGKNAHEKDLRIFLLGSCMGALLHQRGILALHASSIATKRGAVLFMGVSGIGKSTILNDMVERNYQMIADDITGIISPTEKLSKSELPIVIPAFPRSRLWKDSAQRLGLDISTLSPTREQMDKYDYPISPSLFMDESLPIYRIYWLNSGNKPDVDIVCLSGIAAFDAILGNTYRYMLLAGLSVQSQHFQIAAKVGKSIDVYKVTRPPFTMINESMADVIEEHLRLS